MAAARLPVTRQVVIADSLEATAPDSQGVIAATKLHIPVPREGIVEREMLVDRLVGAASDRLDGLRLEPSKAGTALVGDFVDQAQLYGALDMLRNLGVELVSVNAED